MADENDKPGLDPQPRRRVPPPTIDLEASDVSPAEAASEPASQTGAHPGPDAGAETSAEASPETASGSAPPEPPPAEPGATDGPPPGDEPARDTIRPEPRRRGGARAAIGSAAVGAALALIGAGAAWVALAPDAGDREQADAVAARLSRLEAQLAALPKSAPPTVDPKALGAVESRLGAVETALAHPKPPAPDPAIAELRRRLDETTAMARAATQRADAAAKAAAESSKAATEAALAPATADAQAMAKDLAPRADVDALAKRFTQLESDQKALGDRLANSETSAKGLADRLAKAETRSESKAETESAAANAATSAAARAGATAGDASVAVAALALARAVERGVPYSRELAAVDQARADKGALDKLGPLASSGVPSAAALSRELTSRLPAVRAAAEPPAPEGGLIDRLKADAARLVRVRPIGAPEGNAPPEILARLETAAAHDDLASARVEAERLPPAARAPIEPWLRQVAQREAALAAASAVVAQALDALRTSSVPGAPSR